PSSGRTDAASAAFRPRELRPASAFCDGSAEHSKVLFPGAFSPRRAGTASLDKCDLIGYLSAMEPLTRGHRPGKVIPRPDRMQGLRARPLRAVPHRGMQASLDHLSDEQLFQRYTDGDEKGFQLLMERYEPRIQGFLRKRLS